MSGCPCNFPYLILLGCSQPHFLQGFNSDIVIPSIPWFILTILMTNSLPCVHLPHTSFQRRNYGKMELAYLAAYNIGRNKQCCRLGGFSPTCRFSFLPILSYLCMPNSQFLGLFHIEMVYQVLRILHNVNISYNT